MHQHARFILQLAHLIVDLPQRPRRGQQIVGMIGRIIDDAAKAGQQRMGGLERHQEKRAGQRQSGKGPAQWARFTRSLSAHLMAALFMTACFRAV